MPPISSHGGRLLPPLVLTGGPAVGKSVTGRRLAEGRPRAAFVDVDDIRQLVVAGAEAPWLGPEGDAQAALGAENACGLARRFLANGYDVVIADVLTPTTAEIYRREMPTCRIVHLVVDIDEARRRAATRRIWLTDEEFELLHRRDSAHPPDADVRLRVAALDLGQQIAAVGRCWSNAD
jgi:predicted kinase